MLKVLLIDDEYFIREGLKTIIDWKSFGYEVCGDSENGKDGLEKVFLLSPDLIIVDVKMPVMGGLEMVEELRKRGCHCRVIILTAYPDFKFAQKSIELGIDSYLLKPVDPQELIQKLENVQKEIHNNREISQCVNKSIYLSKEKIIEDLVIGNIPDVLSGRYNSLYGLNFPWKSYTIGLIDTDRDLFEEIQLKSVIKPEIEKAILESGYGYIFQIKNFIGILLKNMDPELLPKILKWLQERIFRIAGVSLTISLGETVEDIQDIQKSYLVACRLMDKKFIYGHKKILMQDRNENAAAECSGCPSLDMEKILNRLYHALDVNNQFLINDLLEEIKNWFMMNESEEEIIKIHYIDLFLTITDRLMTRNDSPQRLMPDKKEFMSEVYKKTSLADLHGYVKYKLISFSEELCAGRPSNTMKRILDYIDRNYAEDIKLEMLAYLFNYNATYLGKLFKSYTGQYFNTYLDYVRIEKAKLFLQEGLKVYQVVKKVGYGDIDYFYKKFKKYTGVSPSFYKCKEQ